jgi:sugar fermentation stimulation protein A
MEFPPLLPGRFVRRDNRFRVTVEAAGRSVAAHLPNSGRLTELLTPGRPCWLAPFDDLRRKTRFDLKLVAYADQLVSVDARLPNALFAEALAGGRLGPPFSLYEQWTSEVAVGESRLDFCLRGKSAGVCWVEVKSVTLVEDENESGVARFPDAPTTRGARHLRELAALAAAGDGAAVGFIIQRADAQRFAPHNRADAAFGAALRGAARSGVGVYAWTCDVTLRNIVISRAVPVDLTP